MRRFFIFAVAAALAAGMSATTWSQTGGGAGGGTSSSGASASGGAGTSGAAGTSGTAGAAGTTGTAGAAGTAGTAGGVGTSGAVGTPGAAGAANRSSAAGTAGIGTSGAPGLGRGRADVNGRANANAGLNNAANRNNLNGNDDFVSRTPFFSDPGVRRQLNLNNTQFNALNNAHQNAFRRFNQGVSNLDRNLTPEQRAMQIQQLQAQFNQDLSGTVNSTITNPQTLSRFNQLNRQFMGFNAFNDPAIRQQLNLSQAQTRQLRTLSNNFRQQLQQFRRGAGNDLSSVDPAQWNQIWQQYTQQLNGVLTPEQQQIWTQQVGQPFVFPPSVVLGEGGNGTVGNINSPTVGSAVPPVDQLRTGSRVTSQGTQGSATQGGTTATQDTARQGGTTATQGTSTQGGTTATQGTGTQGGTAQTPQGSTVR